MAHSLTISYGKPPLPATTDFVLVEQEEWGRNQGYLTKGHTYAWLSNRLFHSELALINCGSLDGSFAKYLFVYPSRADLQFTSGVSWGELQEPQVEELEYQETVQCDLQDTIKLKYPARQIKRYEWLGNAYSATGEVVPRPAVSISGGEISLAQRVYGSLQVQYLVHRLRCRYQASPRPEAVENKLQAFAYAVWPGSSTHIEIEPPDGAEQGLCNSSVGSGSISGLPDVPSSVPPDNDHVYIDYCTMKART